MTKNHGTSDSNQPANPGKLMEHTDSFIHRHIGPSEDEIRHMWTTLGFTSLDSFISAVVPQQIRSPNPLKLGVPRSEFETLSELREIANRNQVFRSFIGMGYSDCITPPVIQRNILENPGWYTQYTPYQAEIAQGRLEALLNFQTLVMDLTGLSIANASLLDEATAAAEAMAMCHAIGGRKPGHAFFVSELCHPQTIAVIKTRAEPLGLEVRVGNHEKTDFQTHPICGALVQYPATDGAVIDYRPFAEKVHQSGAMLVVATDLLSLALLTPPGEWGADIAVGNAQRLGVPYGYGGPHAAFFATHDQYKRQMPGRIVGISKDSTGQPAYRLALQTREQHIRRDKATSNICTAQVLLAIMSSMYAVYHGPEGLRKIAERVHYLTNLLKTGLEKMGIEPQKQPYFDTLHIRLGRSERNAVLAQAKAQKINLRDFDSESVCVALDETTSEKDLNDLLKVFAQALGKKSPGSVRDFAVSSGPAVEHQVQARFRRTSAYLTHPVFNSHRSETELLRYIFKLQARDLSLTASMIPLGSCTMKLNATSEMLPVTWPEFSRIHPFAPLEQVAGYQVMLKQLEEMLAQITGFTAVSLQPNAGSQGEYAGLLAIRQYHLSRGDQHRNVCLIPQSAHGTNPATASMAGMTVVVVACDESGNIDVTDLKTKAKEHREHLAALMVTYPSTHGVFEESIVEICQVVHQNGGQVYMDGANMNAQIGLCRPADLGADVCHLNLHKTFCIPHGGGGPGMGPIAVAKHLAPFIPSHAVVPMGNESGQGAVSAAPWGSASILPISWMYISMMGAEGLKLATQVAILNANYIAKRLSPYYPLLFTGKNGLVAHECIFDLRQFKDTTGVEVEDVAKRLMDYGFHAPTVSFPVAGTMMVEPTESETQAELDRFCEAMILIRAEIAEIEAGQMGKQDNLLKNAPHTAQQISKTEWNHPYSRERAVFPAPWVHENKFWPYVSRINNVLGDRTLICGCS